MPNTHAFNKSTPGQNGIKVSGFPSPVKKALWEAPYLVTRQGSEEQEGAGEFGGKKKGPPVHVCTVF